MGLDQYAYVAAKAGDRDKYYEEKYEQGNLNAVGPVEIAYWRKHPNLHGYIVEQFANGKDECQKIMLDEEDLKQIIFALENDEMYEEGAVDGFFFGRSLFPEDEGYEEQKQNDLEVMNKALKWLEDSAPESGEWGTDNYK